MQTHKLARPIHRIKSGVRTDRLNERALDRYTQVGRGYAYSRGGRGDDIHRAGRPRENDNGHRTTTVGQCRAGRPHILANAARRFKRHTHTHDDDSWPLNGTDESYLKTPKWQNPIQSDGVICWVINAYLFTAKSEIKIRPSAAPQKCTAELRSNRQSQCACVCVCVRPPADIQSNEHNPHRITNNRAGARIS